MSDTTKPKGLNAWVPLEHDPNVQNVFNVRRDEQCFLGSAPPESWLRRVHRRVLTWLAFGRFYVE